MSNGNNTQFSTATTKLRIASIDAPGTQICAQYNPKELSITKSVTWEDHKSRDNNTAQNHREDNQSEQDDLTFKGGAPRTMSIEFFFDGYEKDQSVEPDVQILETLASVQLPDADPETEEYLLRPHHCIITWGVGNDKMRPFLCVINKLDVKYSMWNRDGRPLRATCTISVTEAIKMKKNPKLPDPGSFVEGQRARRLRG
jgi:hypothetical protein